MSLRDTRPSSAGTVSSQGSDKDSIQNRLLAMKNSEMAQRISEMEIKISELIKDNVALRSSTAHSEKSVLESRLLQIESSVLHRFEEILQMLRCIRSEEGLLENRQLNSLSSIISKPVTSTPEAEDNSAIFGETSQHWGTSRKETAITPAFNLNESRNMPSRDLADLAMINVDSSSSSPVETALGRRLLPDMGKRLSVFQDMPVETIEEEEEIKSADEISKSKKTFRETSNPEKSKKPSESKKPTESKKPSEPKNPEVKEMVGIKEVVKTAKKPKSFSAEPVDISLDRSSRRKPVNYQVMHLNKKLRRESVSLIDAVTDDMYNNNLKTVKIEPDVKVEKRKPLANITTKTNVNGNMANSKSQASKDSKAASIFDFVDQNELIAQTKSSHKRRYTSIS